MLAAARHLEQAAVADPTSSLAGVAFEVLVLRWLRITHLGLAVVWIITQRMVREAGEHQGLWGPLILVVGAAAVVLAGVDVQHGGAAGVSSARCGVGRGAPQPQHPGLVLRGVAGCAGSADRRLYHPRSSGC